MMKIYEVFCSS